MRGSRVLPGVWHIHAPQQRVLAVKGQSRFPAAGSTASLSTLGTVGGHQPQHHLRFACALRQLCPEDPISPSLLGLIHGCTPRSFLPSAG